MKIKKHLYPLLVAMQPLLAGLLLAQVPAALPARQDFVTLDAPAAPRERFEDPKLNPSELKQSLGMMLERAEFPTFTRELWRVQWRPDDPIDLYIIRPNAIAHPPVILYLYGYPSDTSRFQDDSYCRAVTSRGSAAIGFVSALTGARYHDRPWKDWFISELPEALGASAHDVQMILNFLQDRTDLDMKKVGMFGQGSGATIAALAAAADPRIRAVDLLDPWGDWDDWLKSSPVLTDQDRSSFSNAIFTAKLRNLDPDKWLPALNGPAVRLQQTAFNQETPSKVQERIAGSMPRQSTTIMYKTIDDYKAKAANGSLILEWINARLREATD